MVAHLKIWLKNGVAVILLCLLLAAGDAWYGVEGDQVLRYARAKEFDYVSWTLEALWTKIAQSALGLQDYLNADQQHAVVVTYLDLVNQGSQLSSQIAAVYADPAVSDPAGAAADLLQQQAQLNQKINFLAPLAEGVLQQQVSSVLASAGLTLGGQPVPPVLYHITPLPMALIVSPREVIRQDEDISVLPDLSLDAITDLENKVETNLNVSALVVPVGGVGIYPTMVMSTTDLNWLAQTVAHEWTHNYLTWHPLGALYYSSGQMRTINETTASLVGTEIGAALIERYYPERVPQPAASASSSESQTDTPAAPVFDYRAEMHTTRVEADALLAQGKIEAAETYMETRRQFFWEHGYRIRRLNQAYFAFYGAYADTPGGAAGSDPVGGAVRSLRSSSASLAAFIQRIAWVTSYERLTAVNQALGITP
jgi:hypothetical protein